MSLEFPCVYFENGRCKLDDEPDYIGWCPMGPCKRETPSRADLIRRMTDEELAGKIYDLMGDKYCKNLPECGEMLDNNQEIPEEKCKDCLLEWLKQPEEDRCLL